MRSRLNTVMRRNIVYEAIIFDLDNTLVDFDASEREAIRRFFSKEQVLTSDNEHSLISQFLKENSQLWPRRNDIGIEQVFTETIEKVYREVLPDKTAPSLSGSLYLKEFEESVILESGAKETLGKLSRVMPLYIISNGLENIQHKRIINAGIAHFFTDIVISDDVGLKKPNREIFDVLIERNKLNRNKVLYVGDSIRDDYYGSRNSGIQFCFFNRKHDKAEYRFDLQVRNLNELANVLNFA